VPMMPLTNSADLISIYPFKHRRGKIQRKPLCTY